MTIRVIFFLEIFKILKTTTKYKDLFANYWLKYKKNLRVILFTCYSFMFTSKETVKSTVIMILNIKKNFDRLLIRCRKLVWGTILNSVLVHMWITVHCVNYALRNSIDLNCSHLDNTIQGRGLSAFLKLKLIESINMNVKMFRKCYYMKTKFYYVVLD